ncbi:aminoimidazole riboside kinase [Raoultella terrigena]|uniref:Aminoimidazole riboside kinase n=1 Tax=Raoultella terrigena TaxID=577 RepID=A0A4U9DAJ6_RAOTE|nr:aminoimidazole riboside kinase [Raoultella terrigena]
MEQIKSVGGWVSFDPNIREDLWQDPALLQACLDRALSLANVVKLSEEELVFISGSSDLAQGIAILSQRYRPELLLVTQGKAGVLAAFQQQTIHFAAKPVSASIPPARAMPSSPGCSPASPPTACRPTWHRWSPRCSWRKPAARWRPPPKAP